MLLLLIPLSRPAFPRHGQSRIEGDSLRNFTCKLFPIPPIQKSTKDMLSHLDLVLSLRQRDIGSALVFFPSFPQPRKYRLGMLEERIVPVGSKARKSKNTIGCLTDRCKTGVPINMVWWNRVTENNLQVKLFFPSHFNYVGYYFFYFQEFCKLTCGTQSDYLIHYLFFS